MKAPALALVALLALGGCSASGTQDEALAALRSQVAGVRAAAEAGDHEEALSRLNALRSDALDMSRQNELSDGDFRQILTAALEVENSLASSPPVPGSTGEVDEGEGTGDDPVVAQPQERVDEQNQSLGGSIRSGNPGRGRDGAPGQAGQDGQDGQDGADGIDGRDGD